MSEHDCSLTGTDSAPGRITKLPEEISVNIAKSVDEMSDLHNLRLVSAVWRRIIRPGPPSNAREEEISFYWQQSNGVCHSAIMLLIPNETD